MAPSAALLALAVVVSASASPAPYCDPAGPRWELVKVDQGVAVVKNLCALPRAWLVGQVRVVSEQEALRAIRGELRDPFDPKRVALVEVPDGQPAPVMSGELGAL